MDLHEQMNDTSFPDGEQLFQIILKSITVNIGVKPQVRPDGNKYGQNQHDFHLSQCFQ